MLGKICKLPHFDYAKTPLINSQCRSMPITIMVLIRIASQCRSLPINADQFLSMLINAISILLDLALIRIDRN